MKTLFATLIMTTLCASAAAAQSPHSAPPEAPARAIVAPADEPGERLIVTGKVRGSDGKDITNASIYVYQTDAKGEYVPGRTGGSDTPRLFAYLRSASRGFYSFETIMPGSYPNSRNPAHIHFEVSAPGYQPRIYEIVFEGDPFINDRFKQQAREEFGGVVIVKPHSFKRPLQVSHDIRLRRL